MKRIYVYFEEDEHARLIEEKGEATSWHDFIMRLVGDGGNADE